MISGPLKIVVLIVLAIILVAMLRVTTELVRRGVGNIRAARQLTDARLSDQEVASVVAWHPSISDEWKGCPGSTPPLPYAITFPPLPKGDK